MQVSRRVKLLVRRTGDRDPSIVVKVSGPELGTSLRIRSTAEVSQRDGAEYGVNRPGLALLLALVLILLVFKTNGDKMRFVRKMGALVREYPMVPVTEFEVPQMETFGGSRQRGDDKLAGSAHKKVASNHDVSGVMKFVRPVALMFAGVAKIKHGRTGGLLKIHVEPDTALGL